jgi:predicted nucleic acid-binding Zn ribbon protein
VLPGLREAADYAKDTRAKAIGDIVRQVMTRRGWHKLAPREQVWEVWERLLGPDAPHTRLEGLRKDVAWFVVDSSALLSELANFRKQEILEVLHREVRSTFVRDIKLRLEKRRAAPRKPST